MSEGRQYPQIELVEREAEIARMIELSRAVAESKTSRVLYFQARGGLGKTRLLQEYPRLLQQPPDGRPVKLLVADIVDLYDFENWRPIEIERKIVDSLRIAALNMGISSFDTIFKKYREQYHFYEAIRGFSHTATQEAEKKIRFALVEALNELSDSFPIALRFDTFELILNNRQPEFAFTFNRERIIPHTRDREVPKTENYSENAGVNEVLKWLNEIVPQLKATLILMAGRPPWETKKQQVVKQFAPDVEIYGLSEIKSPDNIAKFLTKSDFPISGDDDRIPYVKTITKGLPLLLRLFARTHNPDTPAGNTYDFEDNLIAQIFNPLMQRTALPLDAHATFVFCMYILACARRGIRRKALREVFERLGVVPDGDEIDNLADEMLIKTVSFSKLPGGADGAVTPEHILLLHDEIQVLIDQSKKLDDLHYRRPILDYLCNLAGAEARKSGPVDQSLKPLADHMYYELIRNIATGYRTYTIYADLLLRQRAIQDALILASVFWNTLFYAVDRGGETDLPFYDRLAESQQITLDDIRRDEAVRYVKRLRYSDDNAEAAAQAEQLYTEFAEGENILPANQEWLALDASHDQYLFADLCMAWANALSQLKASMEQAKRLLTYLQSWLELDTVRQPPLISDDLRLHQHLIYLRRMFYLGETYNLRGLIYGNQQFFRLAIGDLEKSEQAFNEYKNVALPIYRNQEESTESELTNVAGISALSYLKDDVDNEIAQVHNNLAYRDAEIGRVDKALERSHRVINDFIDEAQIASTYQQALFYNTNALLHLRSLKFQEAKEPLRKAQIAAEKSGVDRAQGLVAHASVLYKRAEWNARKHALTNNELADFNTDFEVARAKLRQQAVVLSELWHDRARFWRDIAIFFLNKGEPDQAQQYLREAKRFLQNALRELGSLDILGLRRANLLETQACLDIINGDDTSATTLLATAEGLLVDGENEEIPTYAQIIAGKIALQRGLVWLHQNETQKALRDFAIALTRSYIFALEGSRSRYQAAFETLITRWVRDDVDANELSIFVRAMYADTEDVPSKASRLVLLRPSAEDWLGAWSKTLKFFADLQQPADDQANEATG